MVKTGLAIATPRGTYARVAPRSGLALKHHITVGGGVIDGDYRGEAGVILFNHGRKEFEIKAGDRVAQLVLEKVSEATSLEVTELPDTQRGGKGFGSTGIAAGKQGAGTKSPKLRQLL